MSTPTPTVRLHRWDEIALEKVTEMISRKIVTGDREIVAQIYLNKGALVPMHSHESEQMTYVLQGAVKRSRFAKGKCYIFLRGCSTRPRRSTTPSSSTSSAPSARTGSITPIRTFTSNVSGSWPQTNPDDARVIRDEHEDHEAREESFGKESFASFTVFAVAVNPFDG